MEGAISAAKTTGKLDEPIAVSVVVPTYNEAENIGELIERVTAALASLTHEIVVVDDDSPDETWRLVDELSRQPRPANQELRIIRRTTDRGLSSAVLLGMSAAQGRVFAVIDADLQHDEQILPDLVAEIEGGADISLGSREIEGGSYGDFSASRRAISFGGAQLARGLLNLPMSDPMSGFFAVSRDYYQRTAPKINPRGFKVLLELAARGNSPLVTEVPYEFRSRVRGATKLTSRVVASYLLALIELSIGRFVSATFSAYALVGLSGVCVRMLVLAALTALAVPQAALVALEVSVLWNFVFNDNLTFLSRRRLGKRSLVRGIVLFHLVSAQGLLVQTGVTSLLDGNQEAADLIGPHASLSFAIGIVAATVGNYFLNSYVTWKER